MVIVPIECSLRRGLQRRIDHVDDIDEWLESLEPNRRAHLNNPIDVWDQFREDQRTPKSRLKPGPLTRQRKGHPVLLEEVTALLEAREALQQRCDDVETTLAELLALLPLETVKRYPDDLLIRVFAKLPEPVQDALLFHAVIDDFDFIGDFHCHDSVRQPQRALALPNPASPAAAANSADRIAIATMPTSLSRFFMSIPRITSVTVCKGRNDVLPNSRIG